MATSERLTPLNRFPTMVHEWFVRQVEAAERRGIEERSRLQTKADAQTYVRSVRDRVRRCFGPEPERTPLGARVTGELRRDGYVIEKTIFESRPGLLVTANLYIPRDRPGPLPAVLFLCGHSVEGKAAKPYQSAAQGLVRQGYVVLVMDPPGQGERLQYLDDRGQPRIGGPVREHLMAGNQQFLVGESLTAWFLWDAVRALDYLLERPEVDPQRVGVTGTSGGGTLTTWLCGVEPRIAMAAPSCFVTTFRRNIENELPADTEQCPPGAIALGLDHADFVAAFAPRPVVLLAQEKDFFDVRGTIEAYDRLRHLYGLLGHEDQVGLFIGVGEHGFAQENREAMYRWFGRAAGLPEPEREPEVTLEDVAELHCTPSGQVEPIGSRRIFDFTRERSASLASERPPLHGASLKKALGDLLQLPQRASIPEYRIARTFKDRGYPLPWATPYLVESEPGLHVSVYRLSHERHQSRPPQGPGNVVLYVAHESSDAELREEPLLREVMDTEPGSTVFACDVRGIGDSKPNTTAVDFHNPYGSDYFYAIHANMLDRPYVGQKTHDVLSVIAWLSGFGFTGLHVVGRGWGALPATFASVLSDRVTRVTLKHALTSYSAVAEEVDYAWPLSTLLPRVLRHFDLPDCYAALNEKRLRLVEPWDAKGEPVVTECPLSAG